MHSGYCERAARGCRWLSVSAPVVAASAPEQADRTAGATVWAARGPPYRAPARRRIILLLLQNIFAPVSALLGQLPTRRSAHAPAAVPLAAPVQLAAVEAAARVQQRGGGGGWHTVVHTEGERVSERTQTGRMRRLDSISSRDGRGGRGAVQTECGCDCVTDPPRSACVPGESCCAVLDTTPSDFTLPSGRNG